MDAGTSTTTSTKKRRRKASCNRRTPWESLIEAMDSRGETAESLGPKVGLKPRSVNAYMYGELANMPLKRLLKFAEVLNVTERQLREKSPFPLTDPPKMENNVC